MAEWLKAPDSKLKNDLLRCLLIVVCHHKMPINIGDFAFELYSRLVYLSGKKGNQYQKAVSDFRRRQFQIRTPRL